MYRLDLFFEGPNVSVDCVSIKIDRNLALGSHTWDGKHRMTVRMPSSGVFHVNVLFIVLYFLSAAGTIFDSHCLCRCMDKTQIVIKNSKYHYKKIETAVYLHTILTNVGSLVCHFNMITKRAFDLLFLRNIHILNTNQYYFVYIEYK